MRDRRIALRLTGDEERKIRDRVPKGMTLTRYIIEACTKRVVRAPDRELHYELRKLGTNLNQIARKVNQGWTLNPQAIREELARIAEELGRLG